MLLFEWDINKNVQNIKKHKVSFQEAESSFYDDYSLIMGDPDHSNDEERFILIGMSKHSNLLIVCHCYRVNTDDNEVIRIISARKADKKEILVYIERNDL